MADVMISARLIEELIEREIERGIPSKNSADGVFSRWSHGTSCRASISPASHGCAYIEWIHAKPTLFEKEMHEANRLTPYHFYHGIRDLTVLHRRGDESCTMNAGMHRIYILERIFNGS